MLAVTACQDPDESSSNNGNNTSGSTFTWDSVFLPDEVSKDSVAATYTGTSSSGTTDAIFLLTDGTWYETQKTSSSSQNVYKGTYRQLSGDTSSGQIRLTITHEANGSSWTELSPTLSATVTVTSGSFTLMYVTYSKQDTSSSSSSGNDNSDGNATVTNNYFNTAVSVLGISETPSATFEGTVSGTTLSSVQLGSFTGTSTLALYSNGWALLVTARRYANFSVDAVGAYYGKCVKNGSVYTIVQDSGYPADGTKTWTGGSNGANTSSRYVVDGNVECQITVSGSKVTKEAILGLDYETRQVDPSTWTAPGDNTGSGGGGSASGVTIPSDVYFPSSDYSDKTVVAVYTSPFNEDQVSLVNVGKYAFIFFADGEWLSTKTGTQTVVNALGTTTADIKQNWAYGTYTKTGTFTSGSMTINRTKVWMNLGTSASWYTQSSPDSETVTVSSGVFNYTTDATGKYTLVSESDNGNGGGGSSESDSIPIIVPDDVSLPSEWTAYTISALYTADYKTGSTVIGKYALFLFSNGEFVDTYKTSSYGSGGYFKGTWVKNSGNFKNGSFTITVTHQRSGSWVSYNKTGVGTATNGSLEVITDGWSTTLQTTPYTLIASIDGDAGDNGGGDSGGEAVASSALAGHSYSYTTTSGDTTTLTFSASNSTFTVTYNGTTGISASYTVSESTATLSMQTGSSSTTDIRTPNGWVTFIMNGAVYRRADSTVRSIDPFSGKTFTKCVYDSVYAKYAFSGNIVTVSYLDEDTNTYDESMQYSYTYSGGILKLTPSKYNTDDGWMTLSQMISAYGSEASEYELASVEREFAVPETYYCTTDSDGNVTLTGYYTGDMGTTYPTDFEYNVWNSSRSEYSLYFNGDGQGFYVTASPSESTEYTWQIVPTTFANGTLVATVFQEIDEDEGEYVNLGTLRGTYTTGTAAYGDDVTVTMRFTSLPGEMTSAGWSTGSYTFTIESANERTVSFAKQ